MSDAGCLCVYRVLAPLAQALAAVREDVRDAAESGSEMLPCIASECPITDIANGQLQLVSMSGMGSKSCRPSSWQVASVSFGFWGLHL